MHLPDSALSPVTSLTAAAAMLPVWATAGRRLRDTLDTRRTPLLAVGAAFCFTIMMFNVPAPGGTTVHPIGGGLMAVLLGPWAAIAAMTVALAVQALFFGDGGVLALGANCFVMAFALPMTAYAVYRVLAGRAPTLQRRSLAAAIGAYVGLNVAALLAAILLGIQPALAHDQAGHALYFPFDVRVTVPAILGAHLTIAGVAEFAITAAAVAWLDRSGIPLYQACPGDAGRLQRGWSRVWAALLLFVALAPLGLLARGEAWGEWSVGEVSRRAGYTPRILATTEERGWKGFNLLPNYLSDHGAAGYVFAGLLGALLASGLAYGAGRWGRGPVTQLSPLAPPSAIGPGQTPGWMCAPSGVEADPGGRRGRSYVERTMETFTAGARDTLLDEKHARAEGLLQRIDPRVKILFALAFVIGSVFTRSVLTGACLYGVLLAVGCASRLPVGLLLRRCWAAVSLFTGAVALPAALNVVTPGRDLFTLWRSPHLSVTTAGVAVATALLVKTAACVTAVMLLTLTTRWQVLLQGMRALGAPRLFVQVLTMTYRYTAVLAESAAEMFAARRSRNVGSAHRSLDQGFLGGAIGGLFGKSVALTEETHSAMVSRGWTGGRR